MLNANGQAVEPPLRMPPAYVDWGLFYREIARCLDSEREFADMCDAVENVLCLTPLAATIDRTTGERVLTLPPMEGGQITVRYVTSTDADGFICCRVKGVLIAGAVLAA